MRSPLGRFSTLALLALASGCSHHASSAAAAPPPAPVQVPAIHPVIISPTEARAASDSAVQPGRFDTGKMWTFENPPLEYFQREYGFTPSAAWLEHVRLATLRLPNCTASFVSGTGLVMSNHHCARESASAVSRSGEDLLTNGFYAERLEDERRVPNLYVDQLVLLRDVTSQVAAAAPGEAGQSEDQQAAAREQRVQDLEQRESDSTRLRCDVTALYYGGRYSLYCYRRYTDVRLVFVPEKAIGYFGGDPDNFTYPRYDLDVSFFRVYENDKPLRPSAFLAWNDSGAKEGDPVFVIGNPGSTSRLKTVAQLQHRRDQGWPFVVRLLESRGDVLADYMARHPEKRAGLINDYFSIQNSLKSFRGELDGLRNPALMARKVAFEQKFRAAVMANPALRAEYGGLWDQIADLRQQVGKLAPTLNALNQGGLTRSRTLSTALTMVRYAQGAAGGAPDSVLRSARDEITAVAIDPELDALILAAQLGDAIRLIGATDAWVAEALSGRSPQDAARAIVSGSLVPDSAKRAALLLRPADVLTSDDPALRLMRDLLPRLRPIAQQYRSLQQQEESRTGQLARALFELYGATIPPDATFTLRIADGVVKGYDYNGTHAPYYTAFYGLYDRHFSNPNDPAFALPPRWQTPPAGFDLRTPLDMVMTNDIIGGNSGSPVVDKAGRVVGLIFDGNIESLPGDFIYTDVTARAVAVHEAAIREALRAAYRARRIVDELGQSGAK